MKKLLAIILSVFMALTVAPMAFATGETIDEALNAGIEDIVVETSSVNARTYNLGGRAAKSGLLIQKGKKFMK